MPGERVTDEELKAALDVVFRANAAVYAERGFQRRIGFGEKAALIVIDLANAWTRPDHAFSCAGMDTIIPANQRLLEAFRARGLPVVFTTTAYDVTEGPHSDMGRWVQKIPLETLPAGSEAAAIDDRLAPRPGELVIVKKMASAFHGTPLAAFLTAQKVDTIVVTGVTACACVRHTIEDGLANGFRPIAVREAIGDRIAGAVEWNLFDIDAKFGDVMDLEAVLDHFRKNTP
ncbi:MAG: isochorismatase family protein [Pseudomonadota bacterium]